MCNALRMSEKKYISIFVLLVPPRRTYGGRTVHLRPSSAAPATTLLCHPRAEKGIPRRNFATYTARFFATLKMTGHTTHNSQLKTPHAHNSQLKTYAHNARAPREADGGRGQGDRYPALCRLRRRGTFRSLKAMIASVATAARSISAACDADAG